MSTVASIPSGQAAGTPTAAQLAQLNSATQATGSGNSTLSESDFLNLLTTQLENQDPLNPTSNTAFISQMATFSQLTAMNTLNTNFQDYSQSADITSAQSYIGRTVSVSGAAESLPAATGTVSGVTVSNGAPELTINGTSYSVSDVTGILPASSSSSAGTSATQTN